MKKAGIYIIWFGSFALVGALLWQWFPPMPESQTEKSILSVVEEEIKSDEPIQPIPLRASVDTRKVALGDKLFHDPRLSKDNTISCAHCHDLSLGGTDQKALSTGMGAALGDVNTPTVFNSSFNFRQFWDGRARNLEDQIDGPLQNEKEMGAQWPEIIQELKSIPEYQKGFSDLYVEGVTEKNIKDAIAEFERSLITPNSRFDQYLRGDKEAITPEEKLGYKKFKQYGCISCHQGVNVGGNMFQTMGKMRNYIQDRGNETKADLGRFNVTGKERDKYKFKVPGLRNVEHTAPYFHDGSADELSEAVQVMAKYQLGKDLPQNDVDAIVKFLLTLSGEYEGAPL